MEQKNSLQRCYRNFYIMLGCWSAYTMALILLVSYYMPTLITLLLFSGGISLLGAFFLIVKSMGFKCPKCDRRYDVRSRPKFCPHCGTSFEVDDSEKG